jgi:abortive infection bacteriophage resistance protein
MSIKGRYFIIEWWQVFCHHFFVSKSNAMASIPFTKSWNSNEQIISILIQRGLKVHNEARALQVLSHVGYYRLSGYFGAFGFSRADNLFKGGTTFEQICAAYDFDFKIRDLVSEALEVIEVDLRAAVAYRFGEVYGAFGHNDPASFYSPKKQTTSNRKPGFEHSVWLESARKEVERSREQFVEHFRQKYTEAKTNDLPVWVLLEVLSFGSISRMISGMKRDDQDFLAARYGLQRSVLVNWVHYLVIVRNTCAHHARLWDRTLGILPVLPAGKDWELPNLPTNKRLSATLLVLYRMLKHIPDAADWAAWWQVRLKKRLADLPQSPITADLGFTDEWYANPIWS